MPFHQYHTEVSPDWIDYNQHMNAGYYNVVLDKAAEALLDEFDIRAYMARTTGTFYSVETHIIYIKELKVGSPLRAETQIVGLDQKRIHLFTTIHHAKEAFVAATGETLLLHVKQSVGKVEPMAAEILVQAQAMAASHRNLPQPKSVGRAIKSIGFAA